ncbi:hypothetical protein [Actinoplanes solisilvae]|uniref:hypothetical protein n=1 Tax=Actinoplanes solisilvae TaxID=2486853 RepID=UPI000FD99ED7|nr:hypothetical protein [Actinoplanes solisilvae]
MGEADQGRDGRGRRPAAVRAAVAAAGDRPRDDDQRAETVELLIEEPDTAFAVAARWIDAGDHGCNGTGLVAALHHAWRDRDHQSVRLLTHAPIPDAPNRLRLRIVDLATALDRLPSLPADTRRLLTTAAAHPDRDLRHAALRCLARWDAVPPDAGKLPPAVLAALPDKEPVIEVIRGMLAYTRGNDAITLVAALEPSMAERLLPELLALTARHTAGIVVARQFAVIPSAAADPAVTAALASAMRSPVEMQRAAAAASWLVLGHPPAVALDVLRTLLTDGDRPDWYLIEVARAAPPLPELVTPLLGSADVWTRVRTAVAHHRITGETGPAATALAGVLGEPGSEVQPVHGDAIEALADLAVLPPEAAGRVREFRDSARRLDRDPVLDERLRDAARRLLRATRSG